jgi:hypothetical protein
VAALLKTFGVEKSVELQQDEAVQALEQLKDLGGPPAATGMAGKTA